MTPLRAEAAPLQNESSRDGERDLVPEYGLVRYGARTSVRRRRRITELERFFTEIHGNYIPATESGLCHTEIAGHHFAEFVDGAERFDRFLRDRTRFDSDTRARLKQKALAAPITRYKAQVLGQIVGLTWEVRSRLKITTFDAVDAPVAEVRNVLHRANDAAGKKRSRAAKKLLPKTLSTAKRQKSETLRRRLAEVVAALSLAADGMPVSELSEILKRPKNSPFFNVAAGSMPKAVTRAIRADPSALLRSELRQVHGRLDLRPQLWVWLAQPAPAIAIAEIYTMHTQDRLPTTEAEYRSYAEERLAEFTPATASVEIPAWFNSEAEQALRASCGITDRKPLLILANEVRNRLLAEREGAQT
jgi:uncharacterized membrane protein